MGIERPLTILTVIDWQLAAITLLRRETPEPPVDVFFAKIQMRASRRLTASRGLAEREDLKLAERTMAILGGYLYSKNAKHRNTRRFGKTGRDGSS